VRCPNRQKLPIVLSREEVRRLLAAVYEPRFRVILQLIYACGLQGRGGLCVRDIHASQSCIHIREAKGGKDRYVPLPATMLTSLREFWKTHRHPKPGLSSRGSRLARTGDAMFGWSRPSDEHFFHPALLSSGASRSGHQGPRRGSTPCVTAT
jgi:integrase